MFMTIIYIIIFFVIIYISYKIIMFIIDLVYHMTNPEKPILKKAVLKSHLIAKHGKKAGKSVYKEIKRVLWRDHGIR